MNISVIVPNYNHKKFLPQRLNTIFNQTFNDFEIILLDDCSTDGSWEILKQFKDHPKVNHCIRNKSNSGSPFRQWKKGIELAQYEWIWIAESDDFSDLNFLKNILEFKKDKNVDFLYCQSSDVDFKGDIIESRIHWTDDFKPNIWIEDWVLSGKFFIEKYLYHKNVIPNASACLFKKSLIKKEFWDIISNFSFCGDWYLWTLILKEVNIGFLSVSNNYFRNHSSVSRIHNDLTKKQKRIYEEYLILIFLESNFTLNNSRLVSIQKKWFSLFNFFDIFSNKELFKLNIYKNIYMLILNFSKFKIDRLRRKFSIQSKLISKFL